MSLLIDTDLEVGAPVRCGPMTLFPLVKSGPTEAADYSCGPWRRGPRVDDGGVVAELVTHNHGDQPVLLIEGETLLGAKQDRVLNVSVLLAAKKATTVPVSCVEAGRWGSVQPSRRVGQPCARPSCGPARPARSSSPFAQGTHRSDQHGVWEEVATSDTALRGGVADLGPAGRAGRPPRHRIEAVLPATGPARARWA